MRYLQYILYGVIVGNWLLGVKGRIFPGKVQGRYAVVAMHSGKDEFILIGNTGYKEKAEDIANFVDDNTMFYITVCYDLLDHNDRAEFDSLTYCPFIKKEDESWIRKARSML